MVPRRHSNGGVCGVLAVFMVFFFGHFSRSIRVDVSAHVSALEHSHL